MNGPEQNSKLESSSEFQLDLLGINGDLAPSTRLRGLYFALTAVNLSESAGNRMEGLFERCLSSFILLSQLSERARKMKRPILCLDNFRWKLRFPLQKVIGKISSLVNDRPEKVFYEFPTGSSVDGLPHIDHANIHMGAALR